MSQELTVAQSFEIIITPEQKELVKKTVFPDATDAELQLFFFDCTRRGIHPLDKLIHPTKRNGKYTPITSIDLFRQRASESGEHMGTEDAVYVGEPGKPNFAASVTVYKHLRGEKCAFTATARWSEYYPGEKQGFMWQKMPHLMLAKCAEALALRKAFPQQLHGLYTHEEMAQAEAPIVNIPQTRPRNDATMVQAATDKYTGEPIRQAADVPQSQEATPPAAEAQLRLDDPSAPKPQSAAEYARQMAESMPDCEVVEGYLASYTLPFKGKTGKTGPGKILLELKTGGTMTLQYWEKDRPAGIGEVGHTYCRVAYDTSMYQNKEQYTIRQLEWIEQPE